MPRPIHAHIDLSALKNNLRIARRHTSSRIMAVIKANAYGHGLLRIAKALEEAEGIALLDIQDAIQLRDAGNRQTILLLEGFFASEDLPLIAEYDLATVIHSTQQLDWLDAQRSLFATRQALVQTRLAYLQNQVSLYKALGGGASPRP